MKIIKFIFRNAPFFVVQVVVACCVAAEFFVVKTPRFALSALPIEVLAVMYLWGNNKKKNALNASPETPRNE